MNSISIYFCPFSAVITVASASDLPIGSLCLIANVVRNYQILALAPVNLRENLFEEQKKLLDWKMWLAARDPRSLQRDGLYYE